VPRALIRMSYELSDNVESSSGGVGSAGIGSHPPLLGLLGPADAVGSIGVAAVGAAGALVGQPVTAVGPSDDGPGAGGWLAGVAFAVQLDHHPGAQDGVLLLAADPLVQLSR
jgi:hypothetical protein